MRPMNNTTICLYYRRKPNCLGDDLDNDFLSPIAFRAKREIMSKRVASIGGMLASSTGTFFTTYNLPLPQSEMKKDDVIVVTGGSVVQNQRFWRVVGTEFLMDALRIAPKDEEEAERKCLKRIEVQ